jgi:hypothetical protein
LDQLVRLFPLNSGGFYEKQIGPVSFDVSNPCVGADTGGKEQIAGSDQKLNYQGNGKHFEIAGNNDEITITGECADIQVLGHDNKITLEAVGSIQLAGQNNLVTYRRGLTGPKPSIQAMGENNKVVVAKE